eukprot:4190154-Prymnesium_polylepis.1
MSEAAAWALRCHLSLPAACRATHPRYAACTLVTKWSSTPNEMRSSARTGTAAPRSTSSRCTRAGSKGGAASPPASTGAWPSPPPAARAASVGLEVSRTSCSGTARGAGRRNCGELPGRCGGFGRKRASIPLGVTCAAWAAARRFEDAVGCAARKPECAGALWA